MRYTCIGVAMNVAIVGAGVMGGGMARRLLSCGHAVSVYDPSPAAQDPLRELGARVMDSPKSAATGNEYIVTSLPRDADVRDAIAGADGVVHGLARGALVVETS